MSAKDGKSTQRTKKYDRPGRHAILSEKHKAFCKEYLIDLNATQAAIRAGYSPVSANTFGTALIKQQRIIDHLKELMDERSKRVEIKQDRVIIEIARLAFNDPRKAFDADGNLLPIQAWPDEVAAAIASIKVLETKNDEGTVSQTKEIKFWDKSKNLDLAARHLGMLKDKVEHTGVVNFVLDKADLNA